jgi:hypothetical protein
MIKPLQKNIFFIFEDDVVKGQFVSSTPGGILIHRNFNNSLNEARWGIVKYIGPEVDSDITVGARILVEPLQWTEGLKVDDMTYWVTNSDKVMLIDDEYIPQ